MEMTSQTNPALRRAQMLTLVAALLGWMMALTGLVGERAVMPGGKMEWVVVCLPLAGMILASIGLMRPQDTENRP